MVDTSRRKLANKMKVWSKKKKKVESNSGSVDEETPKNGKCSKIMGGSVEAGKGTVGTGIYKFEKT